MGQLPLAGQRTEVLCSKSQEEKSPRYTVSVHWIVARMGSIRRLAWFRPPTETYTEQLSAMSSIFSARFSKSHREVVWRPSIHFARRVIAPTVPNPKQG